MNIYFDGTLINNDYVTGISFDGKSFNADEIFSLGSTICNNIQLTISKDLATKPQSNVEIQNLGIFNIDNVQENETNYIYTLVDNMINFNFRYNAQPLIEASSHTETDGTKYVYLIELLDDICLQAGTELKTRTFLGYQKHISYYDNTILAREYLSMVAELNSGYAIDNNGIYLKQYTNTPIETILLENCSQYKIGEKHTITRVAMDNGVFEPIGTDDGNTVYLNTNNVFITEQQDLINIYNVINGFEFYSIEASKGDIEISSNTIGECIAFSDGTNLYKAYKQINATYNGGWNGKYSFTIGSIYQEETAEYNGIKDNYTRLKVITDRNNKQIGLLAEQKLDSDEYNKAEIIARINNGAGEAQINADNINLAGTTINLTSKNINITSENFKVDSDGKITSSAGEIAGFDITKEGIQSEYYAPYDYTQSDLDRVLDIVRGQITPTDADIEKYDLNENGRIDIGDANTINYFVLLGVSTTTPLKVGLLTGKFGTVSRLLFAVGNDELTSVGVWGVHAKTVEADNIKHGDGYATKNGNYIAFDMAFDTVPHVVATPVTTTAGVIALKITNITTAGFTVMTGGNTDFGNVDINWIAIN